MHHDAPQQIMLLLIILFPLAGAIFNGLVGRYLPKGLVTLVGVGSVAVSFALAVASFVQLYGLSHEDEHAALVYHFYEWFSVKVSSDVVVPIAPAVNDMGLLPLELRVDESSHGRH